MTVDPATTDAEGTRWARASDALWRRSFGTVIVDVGGVDVDERSLVELSGSAVEIWDLLERDASLDDLVGSLGERFTINTDRLESDVRAFLEQMEMQGVVRRV